MRTLVGVIAAVLVGAAAATGGTLIINNTAAPDKGVNFDDPAPADVWANVPNYGDRTEQGG